MWPFRRSRIPLPIRVAFALSCLGVSLLVKHFHHPARDCNCVESQAVRPTPQGETAAKAALLTWSDIGTTTGWRGGAVAPLPPTSASCPGFRPKQRDLVQIGSAASEFQQDGVNLRLASDVSVLQSAGMLRLDMQRTVLASGHVACLRAAMPMALAGNLQLLSLEPLAFPQIATYTAAWRMVAAPSSNSPVRIVTDQVVLGTGSTEIVLTVTMNATAVASAKPLEVKLALALAARATA